MSKVFFQLSESIEPMKHVLIAAARRWDLLPEHFQGLNWALASVSLGWLAMLWGYFSPYLKELKLRSLG